MKKILWLSLLSSLLFPLSSLALSPSCFCVATSRIYATTTVPTLDAEWWPLLSQQTRTVPRIGGVVLLQYGKVYHTAVVTGFTEYGFTVIEGNYVRCEQTTREILWNDEHIRQFFWFG